MEPINPINEQCKRLEKQIVKHLSKNDKLMYSLLESIADSEISKNDISLIVASIGAQNSRVLDAFKDESIISVQELADTIKGINKSPTITAVKKKPKGSK